MHAAMGIRMDESRECVFIHVRCKAARGRLSPCTSRLMGSGVGPQLMHPGL